MTAAFNPTSLLSGTFFANAGIEQVPGGYAPIKGFAPAGIVIGITILAGALMFFAAYAFFVAGISFVGRLIELWVLIVFSPFAFMSFSIPLLAHVEYIGWDAWFKRLFKVSFMAPIFMFFMYFIFLLLQKGNPFGNLITNNGGKINTILLVVIPAVVILILLLKATEYAKKGSGKLGEMASTAGKMIGGLAVGSTIGGAAVLGRATLGRAGAYLANTQLAQKWEAHGFGGEYFKRTATAVGGASFDVRGAKIGGKTLAGATGIPLGEAKKGGFIQGRKEQEEYRQKRAEGLAVGEDEKLMQNLHGAEEEHQSMLRESSHDIEQLDRITEMARKRRDDANGLLRVANKDDKEEYEKKRLTAEKAAADVVVLQDQRRAIKNATGKDIESITKAEEAATTAIKDAAANPEDKAKQDLAHALAAVAKATQALMITAGTR